MHNFNTNSHKYSFHPRLAASIGVEEAIIVDRLLRLIDKEGERIDGVPFVRRTISDLHRDEFPFWRADFMRRRLARLEEIGIITVVTVENERAKLYTVDFGRVLAIFDFGLREVLNHD